MKSVMKIVMALLFSALLVMLTSSCTDSGEVSRAMAVSHAEALARISAEDVAEVRRGLPLGAKLLAPIYDGGDGDDTDPQKLQIAIRGARDKVQDLRVAKGTFFALISSAGRILRTNLDQDRLAGASAFGSYPALLAVVRESKYLETVGSMPEAAGVNGGPDGQWVAAAPIVGEGKVKAIFATGWSWTSYAYRLENAVRGEAESALKNQGRAKMPLLYVYVIAGKEVYGAPISPRVSAEAIKALNPLEKSKSAQTFSTVLEITGRRFGLGVASAPALGNGVGIAVLRSET